MYPQFSLAEMPLKFPLVGTRLHFANDFALLPGLLQNSHMGRGFRHNNNLNLVLKNVPYCGSFCRKTHHHFSISWQNRSIFCRYQGKGSPSQLKNLPVSWGCRLAITWRSWLTVRAGEKSFSGGHFFGKAGRDR